jgi:hypothetical protein
MNGPSERQQERARKKCPSCRRCGQMSASLIRGNPGYSFVQSGVCWDCRQDLAAGGPDDVTAEELVDAMDRD